MPGLGVIHSPSTLKDVIWNNGLHSGWDLVLILKCIPTYHWERLLQLDGPLVCSEEALLFIISLLTVNYNIIL